MIHVTFRYAYGTYFIFYKTKKLLNEFSHTLRKGLISQFSRRLSGGFRSLCRRLRRLRQAFEIDNLHDALTVGLILDLLVQDPILTGIDQAQPDEDVLNLLLTLRLHGQGLQLLLDLLVGLE